MYLCRINTFLKSFKRNFRSFFHGYNRKYLQIVLECELMGLGKSDGEHTTMLGFGQDNPMYFYLIT